MVSSVVEENVMIEYLITIRNCRRYSSPLGQIPFFTRFLFCELMNKLMTNSTKCVLLCRTPAPYVHVHKVGTPKIINIESKFLATVVYMSFISK